MSGDSVGRHLFEIMCEVIGAKLVPSFPPGFEKIQYGGSTMCHNENLGLRIAQIHTYGLANTSDPYAYDIVSRSYPGGLDFDGRSRTIRFFNTTLKGYKPDYIQLNAGPWDFRVSQLSRTQLNRSTGSFVIFWRMRGTTISAMPTAKPRPALPSNVFKVSKTCFPRPRCGTSIPGLWNPDDLAAKKLGTSHECSTSADRQSATSGWVSRRARRFLRTNTPPTTPIIGRASTGRR